MKKKTKNVFVVIMILFILRFLIPIVDIIRSEITTSVYLSHGDDISEITIYSSDNKKEKFDSLDTNLVFYLSDYCAPCMDELTFISQIDNISDILDITVNLLWQDNIPNKQLEKYKFENANVYSLNNEVSLIGGTPYYYLVEHDKIILATDDIDVLIMKIIKMNSNNDFKELIFKDLCNSKKIDKENANLIFSAENCEACADLINDLGESSSDNNIYIMDYQSRTVDSNAYIYDQHGLYKQIFQIFEKDCYPTVVTWKEGMVYKDD